MSREQAAGESLAYACLIRGTGKTVALYGRNAEQVRAEVADLQHGLQFVPMATVAGSDDVEVCRDADALVLTAGVPFRPGRRRLDLAAGSVAICRDLLPRLLEVAPGAVLVIVTNPVDVVTYAALKIGGLPPHRVLGSGTVLDSSRLRSLIAQRCSVAVQNVRAYATDQLLPAMNEHLALEEERVVPLIEKYDTQAEYAHVAREGSAEVPPDKLPVMADMFRYETDTAIRSGTRRLP